MAKIPFITIILLAIFLFSSVIFAAQAPPSPLCEINAQILNAEGFKADIKITSVVKMIEEGYSPEITCEGLYSNKVLEDVYIVYGADLKTGQKIKAVITYSGDEFQHGYSMSDIVILEDSKEDEKTSTEYTYYNYIIPIFILLLIIIAYLVLQKRKK